MSYGVADRVGGCSQLGVRWVSYCAADRVEVVSAAKQKHQKSNVQLTNILAGCNYS